MFRLMETFVAVSKTGGFTAAARLLGVTPVMVGKRMDELERRVGCVLVMRSTRKITLTDEGGWFYEECERILKELSEAQSKLTEGSRVASGHLRITAPAGFGRRHVATLLPKFQQENPLLTVTLNLTDRIVDIESERYDCAIRVGDLENSDLAVQRLAENRTRLAI